MLIFKDVFSGEEVGSDSFPIIDEEPVLCLQGSLIRKSLVGNVDIGANASAEGGDETYDDQVVSIINIVDAHGLQTTSYDKKSYMGHIREYLKNVVERLKVEKPERVAPFQLAAKDFVAKVIKDFGEYSFYTGPSYDPTGMVILMKYSTDGSTPYFYIWKDGISQEKY
eukprot:TRINITY_DN2568_c0_g1_i1.p1 TRINITY_DN2568_c0_g1~~TRINITY_DN2568_c0_g1_i1.p1  ORF type:complete len:168 (-),score=66.48 TRINITY_DN2568_c0_g1_i1:75-578(-)